MAGLMLTTATHQRVALAASTRNGASDAARSGTATVSVTLVSTLKWEAIVGIVGLASS